MAQALARHCREIQGGEVMARDCKKCIYFQGMHPNYDDSFGCQLDPYCSWMQYKEKKVCKNYEEKGEVNEKRIY